MTRFNRILTLLAVVLMAASAVAQNPRVTTKNGVLEGKYEQGLCIFLGVPFAQPPVGDLRWVAPQPVKAWQGVREAKEYGPNPMQEPVFGDMAFGTKKMSEDCLYLNIWSPAKSASDNLPVFIYFNGGGFMAGSGSEPRYAGDALAHEGIIAITANYRMDIFGCYANKELSKETSYKGSGNYGYMDQAAAIQWVKDNIAAFGGDPNRITIEGESAGSYSTSALCASPMSRNNIARGMGSSGSWLDSKDTQSLKEAEKEGAEVMKKLGCKSIKEMRAMPAEELLKKAHVSGMPKLVVDGKFMPEPIYDIYAKGEQAQVPMFIGGNNLEFPVMWRLAGKRGTVAMAREWAAQKYGEENADKVLKAFRIYTDDDVNGEPGNKLASVLFIDYGTWKWLEMESKTDKQPVYRYLFCHPRPEQRVAKEAMLAGGTKDAEKKAPLLPGAVHSADIEYQMGTLATNRIYDWTPCCTTTSTLFLKYTANFVKTGNPNGLGLPEWKPCNGDVSGNVLYIDVNPVLKKAEWDDAYRVVDQVVRSGK